MNSNEEYLDELLKSIEPITNPEGIDDDKTIENVVDQSGEIAIDPDSFDALLSNPNESIQNQEEEQPSTENDSSNSSSDNTLPEMEKEDHLNMSEDEIDALINDVKNSTPEEETEDSTDVKELLKQFTDDEDLSDIHSILEKNDNDEAVDTKITDDKQEEMEIPLSILTDDSSNTDEVTEENDSENSNESVKKHKKRDRKKKVEKEKKENLFTKVLNLLTEEDEDEDEKEKVSKEKNEVVVTDEISQIPEKNETGITDENLQILDELSKEDIKKNKKLKKKIKDKKKGKSKESSSDDETDDTSEQDKGKKSKKLKLRRKEKKSKTPVQSKPEKKLPKKRVISTFAFCFTILAVILIMSFVLEELNNIRDARWAFDNEDYETCYENLYGLDLNDENQSIFNKSETILIFRKKLSSYENYKRLGMDMEALNALFDGVRMYPQIQTKAQEYNVLGKVEDIYNSIVAKFDEYGLTQDDVNEILSYNSKVKYTKRLQSIVDGTPFVYEDDNIQQEQTIDDILPEEEDFLPEDPNSIFDTVTKDSISEDSSNALQDTESSQEGSSESNVQDNQPVRVGSNSANKGTRVTNGNMDLSSEIKDGSVVIDSNNNE